MNNILSCIAMAAPQNTDGAQPNQFLAFVPILVMFGIFYFLLIRPQQKRQLEHEKMLKEVKKGDKIVTNGGLIGTIVGLKEKELVIKVGDNDTKLEIVRTAVSHIVKE
jgi:preprotein translocase subunit YajC